MSNNISVIVYGYGNPGRQDDGLGVALAERLRTDPISGVAVDINYQLNVEDSLTISKYDIAVFVDASVNDITNYTFSRLEPAHEVAFSTHAMSPQSILAFCHELYNKNIKAYLLEIKGYQWEGLIEGLTEPAIKNLDLADAFLRKLLNDATAEAFEAAAVEAKKDIS